MRRLAAAALGLLLLAQAPPAARVDDLAWLAGRWTSEEGGRWTEEVWAPPRGGVMLGFSRSGRGETLGEFEFLRIQAGGDGVPVYLAQPGGRPPVGFRLAAHEGEGATFENPAHDFPQRIRYSRDGDRLVATISTLDGGNAQSWTYRRQ